MGSTSDSFEESAQSSTRLNTNSEVYLSPGQEAAPRINQQSLQELPDDAVGPNNLVNVNNIFFAAFLFRVATVIVVIFTLPIRNALPLWMYSWFQRISYPLLLLSSISLLFHKKLVILLNRYSFLLLLDLSLSIGIIQIGGGWRSSYFGYTVTTIILFSIFRGRRGAYFSSIALIFAAIIKDPAGGLPSLHTFSVSSWDMRLGALFMYLTAGLILGYFSTIVNQMENLARREIVKSRMLASMEEKTRLSLELHDGAKQIVSAILLKMHPMIKHTKLCQDELSDDLRWIWKGMNYLQSELNQVMDTLKKESTEDPSTFLIAALIEEEAKIAEAITGFSWNVLLESHDISLFVNRKLSLRKFLSEALMNAWKHSGVHTGNIALKRAGDSVELSIHNDGKGFDLTNSAFTNTTGLKSLKYRASELNGRLVIDTAPETGCKIFLTIPICSDIRQTIRAS